MQVERIDHLVLTVANIEQTILWYTEVLGMRHECFGEDRHALHFGRQKLNLHPTGSTIEPRAAAPTAGAADLCLILGCSLAEAMEHLRANGVQVLLGPIERTGATGRLSSLYIRDPDQNLIELATVLDPTD